MDEKSMKKMGQETHGSLVTSCRHKSFTADKWFHNRSVTMLSNCCSLDPAVAVTRWDKKVKDHISLDCPATTQMYNSSMGGADLLDKMYFSYRFALRSKRWYMYLFWHIIKIVGVNAWFLHKVINSAAAKAAVGTSESISRGIGF